MNFKEFLHNEANFSGGKRAVVFHRTPKENLESFKKHGRFDEPKSGQDDQRNLDHGRGEVLTRPSISATFDLEDQLNVHMAKGFGDIIIKGSIDLHGFLITDEILAKEVYGSEQIQDQLKLFLPEKVYKNFQDLKFKKPKNLWDLNFLGELLKFIGPSFKNYFKGIISPYRMRVYGTVLMGSEKVPITTVIIFNRDYITPIAFAYSKVGLLRSYTSLFGNDNENSMKPPKKWYPIKSYRQLNTIIGFNNKHTKLQPRRNIRHWTSDKGLANWQYNLLQVGDIIEGSKINDIVNKINPAQEPYSDFKIIEKKAETITVLAQSKRNPQGDQNTYTINKEDLVTYEDVHDHEDKYEDPLENWISFKRKRKLGLK